MKEQGEREAGERDDESPAAKDEGADSHGKVYTRQGWVDPSATDLEGGCPCACRFLRITMQQTSVVGSKGEVIRHRPPLNWLASQNWMSHLDGYVNGWYDSGYDQGLRHAGYQADSSGADDSAREATTAKPSAKRVNTAWQSCQ